MDTWNPPLVMNLVNNVVKKWSEDDDNESNQGKKNVMGDQQIVPTKERGVTKKPSFNPSPT
jgi:hypothetical protein